MPTGTDVTGLLIAPLAHHGLSWLCSVRRLERPATSLAALREATGGHPPFDWRPPLELLQQLTAAACRARALPRLLPLG